MRSGRVVQVVRKALCDAGLRRAGGGMLLGVSGGSDSVAMLAATVEARRMLGIAGAFEAMTVDHGLRAASSDEVAFVGRLAGELGVSFHSTRVGVRRRAGGSLEEAARRVRYDRLARRARRIGAEAILVGHTADDQAETVLLNLLRGAVVTGVGGIPPVRRLSPKSRQVVVRPVLGCSRDELRRYLARRKMTWCEDESNLSLDFTRNRVRHVLLDLLKREFNPEIVAGLCRLSERSRAVDEFLRRDARRNVDAMLLERHVRRVVLDAGAFGELEAAQRYYALNEALARIDPDLSGLRWSELEKLEAVMGPRGGRRIRLPSGVTISRERERLVIALEGPDTSMIDVVVPVALAGTTDAAPFGARIEATVVDREAFDLDAFVASKSVFEEAFDAGRVGKGLCVRTPRRDDRFGPLGGTPRKLTSFLSSQGLSRPQKERQPVIADVENVIWVVGLRPAHATRVTRRTQRVLALSWRPC